jgi:hypothetical protein
VILTGTIDITTRMSVISTRTLLILQAEYGFHTQKSNFYTIRVHMTLTSVITLRLSVIYTHRLRFHT